MSRDRNINTPTSAEPIGCKLNRVAAGYRPEDKATEPLSVITREAERFAKEPCFVPPARMVQIEAIILELADIENCPTAVWQWCHLSMVDRTPGAGYAAPKALG